MLQCAILPPNIKPFHCTKDFLRLQIYIGFWRVFKLQTYLYLFIYLYFIFYYLFFENLPFCLQADFKLVFFFFKEIFFFFYLYCKHVPLIQTLPAWDLAQEVLEHIDKSTQQMN